MVDIKNIAEFADNTIQNLVDSIASNRRALTELQTYGKIYTLFEPDDIIINKKNTSALNFWHTNTYDLINMQTASMQSDVTKKFYFDVEIETSLFSIDSFFVSQSSDLRKQFSVFYGNRYGSGSLLYNDFYPSFVTYRQYVTKCLEPEDDTFTFGDGVNTDQIYGIAFDVNSMGDGISTGYFQLALRELTGDSYSNLEYTGSNIDYKSGSYNLLTLIPDTSSAFDILNSTGRVLNLVSGSIADGIYINTSNTPEYYGIFYPDQGLVILNGDKLDGVLNFNSVTGSNIEGDNILKLFKSIEGAVVLNNGTSSISDLAAPPPSSFIVRSSKTTNSNIYFVNLRSYEYNYSTNPSFIDNEFGALKYKSFVQNPVVYITSVGLYNDENDLVAVAKLSRPVRKEFGKEYLIKIKLEF